MGTPGTDVKIKAWTPAVICRIQDNIISSKFANAKVFLPSYESTRSSRPCMGQLLTNEYQRIWWQEKEAWDKKFSRKTVSKSLLQRKVIPRQPPTKDKSSTLPTKIKRKVPEKKAEVPLQKKESKKDTKEEVAKPIEKEKEPEIKKEEAKPEEVPETDKVKEIAEAAPAKEIQETVQETNECRCMECENL